MRLCAARRVGPAKPHLPMKQIIASWSGAARGRRVLLQVLQAGRPVDGCQLAQNQVIMEHTAGAGIAAAAARPGLA